MEKNKVKGLRRSRRKQGLRKQLFGTPTRPRLTVFRSNKHIYAQIIDDLKGDTLAAASTNEKEGKVDGKKTDAAQEVGKRLAERAKARGVASVCFDRNGFRYHGRIRALADAAREGGLQF